MKKVVMTVFGILALAASANAQTTSDAYGNWYTDYDTWRSLVTNVQTAEYARFSVKQYRPILESGITATATGNGSLETNGHLLTSPNNPTTFTFSGNAFSGQFSTFSTGSIDFSIDDSLESYNLTPTESASNSSKFLGYISKSSSDISVKLTPRIASGSNKLKIQSFSSGQSIAPEPGTLALALTGGCALLGMCIRRRRTSN